jgi:hypothetical protein
MSAIVLENVPSSFTKKYWKKIDFNNIFYILDWLKTFWVWWDWMDWRTKDGEVIPTKKDEKAYRIAMEEHKKWVNFTIYPNEGKTPDELRNLIVK